MAVPNPDADPNGADRDDADTSTPPLPDADVDARWADIVSHLADLDVSDDERPDGVDPDVREAGGPDTGPDADADDLAATPSAPGARVVRGPRDWPTTPEVEELEDAETHFTPPEPEPVLSRDPLLTLSWALVVGVPLLAIVLMIVVAAVPGLHLPSWLGPAGAGAFAVGLAALVWRMPHQRDPDDPGSGAVV
jgi:hypothetical protein